MGAEVRATCLEMEEGAVIPEQGASRSWNQGMDSPREPPEEPALLTLDFSPGGLTVTSGLQRRGVDVCHLKPLRVWSFAAAAVGA